MGVVATRDSVAVGVLLITQIAVGEEDISHPIGVGECENAAGRGERAELTVDIEITAIGLLDERASASAGRDGDVLELSTLKDVCQLAAQPRPKIPDW